MNYIYDLWYINGCKINLRKSNTKYYLRSTIIAVKLTVGIALVTHAIPAALSPSLLPSAFLELVSVAYVVQTNNNDNNNLTYSIVILKHR